MVAILALELDFLDCIVDRDSKGGKPRGRETRWEAVAQPR